jgi:hypothetical protein
MYLSDGQAPRFVSGLLRQQGDVCLPDYNGRGLFNLAVTLARVCGSPVHPDYPELLLADGQAASHVWSSSSALVFLLVDGLGDHFLSANRDCAPHLWRDRVGYISSVFPSTTATAITTVMTAEPATVHGLLGWFVRDEISNQTVAPLPMRVRGSMAVPKDDVVGRLLQAVPLMQTAQRQTHLVTLPALSQGPFSRFHAAGAAVHGYNELGDMAEAITKALGQTTDAQYVYAYTPLLDRTAHDCGIDSEASRAVLAQVDATYARIREALPHAVVVVAADHGFIDNPSDHQIDLMDHPDIHAMLRAPLSGEQRTAYCHVLPTYRESFGRVVNERFGHALVALNSTEVLEAGLFGPGRASPETVARCGDWILTARTDWTVRDSVVGELAHPMIGVHGGLSEAEMHVPLIVGM